MILLWDFRNGFFIFLIRDIIFEISLDEIIEFLNWVLIYKIYLDYLVDYSF